MGDIRAVAAYIPAEPRRIKAYHPAGEEVRYKNTEIDTI